MCTKFGGGGGGWGVKQVWRPSPCLLSYLACKLNKSNSAKKFFVFLKSSPMKKKSNIGDYVLESGFSDAE